MMDIRLSEVIAQARTLIGNNDFRGCEKLLRRAMSDYPDAAVPHNLMGLMYEKKNDHVKAMKHFRAAWALDPTYVPAQMNLDNFGTMFAARIPFTFDESDYAPVIKAAEVTPQCI